MDSLWLQIIAILVLVLANGFFALSEFSVIASRKSRLKQKVAEGKSGAAAAEKIRANPDRFLATIQVGITLF
nr:CNNM domain-containing protein [candidate division Zixibacteria bacterium]